MSNAIDAEEYVVLFIIAFFVLAMIVSAVQSIKLDRKVRKQVALKFKDKGIGKTKSEKKLIKKYEFYQGHIAQLEYLKRMAEEQAQEDPKREAKYIKKIISLDKQIFAATKKLHELELSLDK